MESIGLGLPTELLVPLVSSPPDNPPLGIACILGVSNCASWFGPADGAKDTPTPPGQGPLAERQVRGSAGLVLKPGPMEQFGHIRALEGRPGNLQKPENELNLNRIISRTQCCSIVQSWGYFTHPHCGS